MSWIWSSPAPDDESSPSVEEASQTLSVDPYSAALSSGAVDDGDFGTAFTDDLDPAPSTGAFDLYTPPPSTFDFPPPTSSASSSPSAIDFNAMGRINPSVISPRAQLRGRQSAGVDYVFEDDYKEIRRKNGAEQLTNLAGLSYIAGALGGGSWGCYEALRASAGKPGKLRLNAVLNGTGKRGALMANAFGVLALGFSLTESAIHSYASDEGWGNFALAGGLAGGLYKSTRGPRVAAIWALGGAALSVGTVYASRHGFYGKGMQGIL